MRSNVQIISKTTRRKEAAKLEKQGVKPAPSFEDSRDKIEQILTEQRVDQAAWSTRCSVRICSILSRESSKLGAGLTPCFSNLAASFLRVVLLIICTLDLIYNLLLLIRSSIALSRNFVSSKY